MRLWERSIIDLDSLNEQSWIKHRKKDGHHNYLAYILFKYKIDVRVKSLVLGERFLFVPYEGYIVFYNGFKHIFKVAASIPTIDKRTQRKK